MNRWCRLSLSRIVFISVLCILLLLCYYIIRPTLTTYESDRSAHFPSGLHEVVVTSASKENKRTDNLIMGQVNYDSWLCEPYIGTTVDDIRIRHDWPNKPTKRQSSDKIHVFVERLLHLGTKQYGYIVPPLTGIYEFYLSTKSTAAVSAEFWLSIDSNLMNLKKKIDLLNDQKKEHSNNTASIPVSISLKNDGVYYFEFHVKSYKGLTDVSVMWKLPSHTKFETVSHSCLALAVKLENGDYAKTMLTSSIVQSLTSPSLPSNKLQSPGYKPHVTFNVQNATELKILPECQFPINKLGSNMESSLYPANANKYKLTMGQREYQRGYRVFDEKLANNIIQSYTSAFKSQKKYRGKIIGVHSIETPNGGYSSLFLLEMDIKLTEHEKPIRISEYVFNDKGHLCHASNFQWQQDVDVYVVVAIKNIGSWVNHFIYNFENIYQQTHDNHFEVIIVDYSSTDINIEEELKKSSLPRYKLITLKGRFSRAAGLQAGINYVTNDNSIIVTTDLQLTFPTNYIDSVRKHTIKGKLAYAPMFFRLSAGYSENTLIGYWSDTAYGQFALFKSDWTKIGGFNLKKYTTNWGGEDWDILLKTQSKSIKVIRLRMPGYFHYQHSKAGMWGSKPNKDETYGC